MAPFGRSARFSIQGWEELRQARPGPAELAVLRRIVDHLEPGDVVYDVGANIGFVSLVVAAHLDGPSASVHCFEPEPRNFESLVRNIGLNGPEGRVVPHRLALGSEAGEAELFVRGGPGEGRHSTVSPGRSDRSIRVPISTVSEVVDQLAPAPNVLKIDVEGGEGRVLAGMGPWLDGGGRLREIFLEIHPRGEADRMPKGEPIDEWLAGRGFSAVWEGKEGSRLHRHYR